jgi:MFS family permease
MCVNATRSGPHHGDEFMVNDLSLTLVLVARMIFGFFISLALPSAFFLWGPDTEVAGIEGPEVLGFLAAFWVIGGWIALAYCLVGTLLHYFLRKNARWRIAGVDLILAGILVGMLVYAGANAEFH